MTLYSCKCSCSLFSGIVSAILAGLVLLFFSLLISTTVRLIRSLFDCVNWQLTKEKPTLMGELFILAETKGFEPLCGYPLTDFEHLWSNWT